MGRDKRGQEGRRGKVEGVEVTVCTAHPRHQHTDLIISDGIGTGTG